MAILREQPLLSVVTPVYNAEKHLPALYHSLCTQSYGDNWEWVVVNDGSTDNSGLLLKGMAKKDKRIRYEEQRNSGNPKVPRDRGIYHARGEYVVLIDADDNISTDYLSAMLHRQQETDADIVFPILQFTDVQGKSLQRLPAPHIDTSRVYTGKELVSKTIPEWEIGCNGGLYKKGVLNRLCYPKATEPLWMNSDEIDERIYMLSAQRIAFASATYYYMKWTDTITTKFSAKHFHRLVTDRQLLELASTTYGPHSPECEAMHKKLFLTWKNGIIKYVAHAAQMKEAQTYILHHLKMAYGKIDPKLLSTYYRIQYMLLNNHHAALAIFSAVYAPRFLVSSMISRIAPIYYALHWTKKKNEKAIDAQIEQSYTDEKDTGEATPCTVCIFCGNTASGGLVDRLRGAVSTFMVCKGLSADFRIYFTHPFHLEDYLVPNLYDWRIGRTELSFSRRQTQRLVIDTVIDSTQEREMQRQTMHKAIAKARQQTHVYTNAAFCYDADFGELFRELFKPSSRLQACLDSIQQAIGAAYISVSARFLNLLNDFNEENYSEPLPESEQEALLDSCMNQLNRLHVDFPRHKILVCSDSIRFLHKAMTCKYIYTIEGKISHIDNDVPQDYDYYQKTFLDFFTIAQAEKVYLLKGPGMNMSGFPLAASLVGGKPFETIEF